MNSVIPWAQLYPAQEIPAGVRTDSFTRDLSADHPDPPWSQTLDHLQITNLASLTLSLSSFPHCHSFPGSTAKCTGSSLCSESVRGITAAPGQKYHV